MPQINIICFISISLTVCVIQMWKKEKKNNLVKHFLVSPHITACHFYRIHGCDKVTPFPSSASSISISFPDSWCGGGWGGCSAWTREIVLVSAARRRRGEAVSLRIRPARLACLALWSCSMTAQGNITAGGGGCVRRSGGAFVYSCFFHLVQLPSSSRSSISALPSPLLFLCCCCFTPSSETPSGTLKKSYSGGGRTGLQPGELE